MLPQKNIKAAQLSTHRRKRIRLQILRTTIRTKLIHILRNNHSGAHAITHNRPSNTKLLPTIHQHQQPETTLRQTDDLQYPGTKVSLRRLKSKLPTRAYPLPTKTTNIKNNLHTLPKPIKYL